jgi:hypothetical protein
MKKTTKIMIICVSLGILLFTQGYAQEDENVKLAQAGFHFLYISSDARAAAMGNAVTSLQMGSSALFFNPASMSDMKTFFDISVSNNQWIADIKHQTLSMAIRPFKGDYGVLGFSAQYVDYGNFIGTVVDTRETKGYRDVGLFKLYALALGVGYAKQLTDKFSVGAQVRWAQQDLGESVIPNLYSTSASDTSIIATNKLKPLIFDFGTQFKTGVKSLVFGMSIRNFSQDMQYAYESFQLPMIFTLGISMDIMDLFEKNDNYQALYLSVDLSHYRDHPEQLKIGVDYQIIKTFFLRLGYVTKSDERGFSYGVGISKFGFAFDYAYTPFGVFQKVQRMTARFSF